MFSLMVYHVVFSHADAGVGIGMPALVLVKNDDYGYAKSQKKRVIELMD